MKRASLKSLHSLLLLGSLAFAGFLTAIPIVAQDNAQTAPDNTKRNQDQSSPNADQQKMNPSDRAIT
jgi:hypothetical protein